MWYKQAVHYPKSPEHGPITDSLLTHSDRHQYTFDSYRPQSSSTFRLDDYPAFWHTCSFPKILPRKQTHPRITMGHRDADAAQADATSPVSALFAEASPTSDIINHPFGSTGQRQENFAHNSPKRTTTSKPPRPVGSSRPHPDRTSTLPGQDFAHQPQEKRFCVGVPKRPVGRAFHPIPPTQHFHRPDKLPRRTDTHPNPKLRGSTNGIFPFPMPRGRSGLDFPKVVDQRRRPSRLGTPASTSSSPFTWARGQVGAEGEFFSFLIRVFFPPHRFWFNIPGWVPNTFPFPCHISSAKFFF